MPTQTSLARIDRKPAFYDHEGVETFVKQHDSVLSFSISVADLLSSGETASSVSVEAYGPTISGEAVSSAGVITGTVTDSGEAKFTVVTSTSNEIVKRVRWEAEDARSPYRDYRLG